MSLTEDIITVILLRSAVKPLLRFRCVCKSWRALIDGEDFTYLHLNITKKANLHRRLIQKGYTHAMYTVDFDAITRTNIANVVDVPDILEPLGVIGCCDGLVCLSNLDGVCIWNPSTRSFQMLPDLEYGRLPTITFRDSDFLSFSGFGYDVLTDDYKVVFMVQSYYDDPEEMFGSDVFVYSLKSNSWRELKPFPYYIKFKRSSGVLADGSIHWIVGKTQSCEYQWLGAFDLATEEYKIVPQPNYPTKRDFYLYLESLEDCLSLMWGYIGKYVDIWVMKEYGKQESWTKIAKIDVSTLGDSCGLLVSLDYSVSKTELVLEKDMNSMVRYDIEKNVVRDVEILGQKEDRIISHVYRESLLQLKNGVRTFLKKKIVQNSKRIKKAKKRDDFLSKGFKLVL